MRIPSQFNEDNLYRRSGANRNPSTHTYRRLMRLVIGLALVVVVMKQAARPEIYRTFFGPQAGAANPVTNGTPPDSQGGGAATLKAASNAALQARTDSGHPTRTTQSKISISDRSIANQLVAGMPRSEQLKWLAALSRWQKGGSIVIDADSLASTTNALETGSLDFPSPIEPAKLLEWQVAVQSLAEPTAAADEGDSVEEVPNSDEFSNANKVTLGNPQWVALLNALDEAAASRVIDGSVWRSPDFDHFYRCLDQADQMPVNGIASTGVIPLLQQPDVFLNQLVAVHGSVARAEQMPAQDNPFGIQNYWQLWLRPSDGADRPLVAIVPDAPELVAAVGADSTSTEGPQVTVVGRFLKRLAYKSSIGADLAPVVVGRITHAPVTARERPASESTESGSTQLWLVVIAASVFGISLALLLMWRTGAMASRARVLRTSHRKAPNDFLQGLSEQTSPNASSLSDKESS